MVKNGKNTGIVRFECKMSCGGKCCNGGTQVLASELKNVVDDVPIVPEIIVIKGKNLPKRFLNRVKQGAILVKAENTNGGKTERFYVYLDFAMGTHKGEKDCYFLKDGMCAIEDSKPLKCRLLPVHPLVPEELMQTGFHQMRDLVCSGFTADEECPNPPVIWENGVLKMAETKRDISKYFEELEKQTKFLGELLGIDNLFMSETGRSAFQTDLVLQDLIERLSGDNGASIETRDIIFPFLVMQKMANEDDYFSSPVNIFEEISGMGIYEFAERQLAAFEKFKKFDPVGWKNTPIYQKQEDEYIALLNDRSKK